MDRMYVFHPKEYGELINQLKTTPSGVWLIKGNNGIGKSQLIKEILRELNLKCLHFEPLYSEVDALVSISNGICSFYEKENKPCQLVANSVMPYPDQLKRHIFSICKTYNSVIYIDDIHSLQNKVEKSFYFDLVQLVCILGDSHPIRVIIEVSDDLLIPPQLDFVYDLSSLIPMEHIIRLHAPDNKMLSQYIFSLLKIPCILSTEQTNRIIESGFNNPLYIKRIIECLKDLGTLYVENNVWRCRNIDTGELYDYLKDHIEYRYSKLESNQQSLLQNASTIGYEIDIDILRYPLGILKAEQKLIRIERISELIKHEGARYRFESDEVFYFIENEMDIDRRIKLHCLLAKHFESLLPPIDLSLDYFIVRQIYWKTANHYFRCNNFEKAIDYFTKYAIASYRLKDYASIIECKKMMEDYFSTNILPKYIRQVWMRLLAEAYQNLGKFLLAANLWEQLLCSYEKTGFRYNLFNFKYAYCLRRGGSVFEAYKILEGLKESIKLEKSELLADVLIVLTGIVDQLGETEDKERYFNWSLDLCQQLDDKSRYYRLLGKSNMFYSAGVAIPLMEEAFCYFQEYQDQLESGKIAYNIGMSLIQHSQNKYAETYLQKACDIFSEFGSRNLSYVFCAFGILCGLEHNYVVAQDYFLKVIDLSTNKFAELTAKLNLYYCYQRTAQTKKAKDILNECEIELEKNGADKLVLLRNLYFAKAMYEFDKDHFAKCYEYILTAYDIETRQLGYKTYNIYFAKWLTRLSEKLQVECASDVYNLSQSHMSTYKEYCYHEKVIWGNLMFW